MAQRRTHLIEQIFLNVEEMKRLMQAQLQRQPKLLDFTFAQLHLLMTLHRSSTLTLSQLAARLSLTPGAITQTVEPLVQDGHIVRTADPTDRRVQHLSLSPSTGRKLSAHLARCQMLFSTTLSALSEADLDHYLLVQQKMITQLQAAAKKPAAPAKNTTKGNA